MGFLIEVPTSFSSIEKLEKKIEIEKRACTPAYARFLFLDCLKCICTGSLKNDQLFLANVHYKCPYRKMMSYQTPDIILSGFQKHFLILSIDLST